MHFASLAVAFVSLLALLTSGCDVTTRFRYRTGTKLYERDGHRAYGQVVSYDPAHDFHNGVNAQPAIEIELDPIQNPHTPKEHVWASCDVVSSVYDTK